MALVPDGKGSRLAWLAELDAKHPPDPFDVMLSSVATEACGTNKAGSAVHHQPYRQTERKTIVGIL